MGSYYLSGISEFTMQPTSVVSSVAELYPLATGAAVANQAQGMRVIIPKTGTLRDFTIWVATAASNVDVGVYDTTATTRNRLWSSGSVAVSGTNAWQTVGDPQLAVERGQHVDFVVASDGTPTFGRGNPATNANSSILPTSFLPAPLGGSRRTIWQYSTAFPLPSTLSEASMANSTSRLFMIARIV